MQEITRKDSRKVYIPIDHVRIFGLSTLLVIAIVLSVNGSEKVIARKEVVACKEFSVQDEAQRVFEANKGKYGKLDRDNDGEACEHLPLK